MLRKTPSFLLFLLFFSSFAIHDSEGGFFKSLWKGIKRVGKGIWNGIKKVGGFLAKNGNVLSAATALIPGVGPAISSGIQIASKVGRALTSTDGLRAQSQAVSRSAGRVQHAATMYALNPTSSQLEKLQQSIQAMAAHGPTLNKIDFNTGEILSTSRKTFERAGQVLSNQVITHAGLKGVKTDTETILGAQQIANGFLRGIDSDLGQVQKGVNTINNKVDISNAKLGELLKYSSKILGKLDSVEKNVLGKIIKLSREVQISFQNLNSELNKGFAMISRKLFDLSREMRDGLNELDQEIEKIGETLKKGIAAILLGQLEQNSKLARECYRSLMDEMNRNDGNLKSNLEILMNVNELSSSEKRRRQKLLERLEDPVRGVEACRAHFRAIYEPASSPFPAGDVFQKLKEKFLFLHPEGKDWSSAEAVVELKSLNRMGNQFFLHLINLFSLKTLTFLPKLSNKDSKSVEGFRQELDGKQESEEYNDQNEALNSFLLDSEEIVEAFEQSFPLCRPSHALLEALETRRLYCDEEPVMEENVWMLSSLRVRGFPVGAVCTFECYGRRHLDPVVCGPRGLWSQVDRNIAANLLNCSQAIEQNIKMAEAWDQQLEKLNQELQNLDQKQQKLDQKLNKAKRDYDVKLQSKADKTSLQSQIHGLSQKTIALESSSTSLKNSLNLLNKETGPLRHAQFCVWKKGPCPAGFAAVHARQMAIKVYSNAASHLTFGQIGESSLRKHGNHKDWMELHLNACCK